MRIIIFIILIYIIIKVFSKMISPMFAGYYEKDTSKNQKGPSGTNKQRVNNIVIDTSKATSKLHPKPDIRKIDAEDVDFEEIN